MESRVPPYSEEAEQGGLGAIIMDSLRLMPIAIRSGLTETAFYVPAHRIVWEAMESLTERKNPVDILTVNQWLMDNGKLELVGGYSTVDRLCDACVTAANGEHYLDIVRQKWALRNVIDQCRETEQECYECEEGEALALSLPERFTGMIKERKQERTNGEHMDSSIERWEKATAGEGMAIGLPLPWENVTLLMCGLEVGITILAGRPSQGKTTVEDQLSYFIASKGDFVGRITLDSTAQELLERGLCRSAGVSLPKLKYGHAGGSQIEAVKRARDMITEMPMVIEDGERELRAICGLARQWKAKHDMKLLTIDFIQLIEASVMGRNQWDANARVSYVSKTLKALSFELGIPVLVLSQLKRVYNPGGKSDEDREPELDDLRDSGSLEQDASKVVFIYADRRKVKEWEDPETGQPGKTKTERPTWLNVMKHKNGETGKQPLLMRPHYFMLEDCNDDFTQITDEKIDFEDYEKQ